MPGKQFRHTVQLVMPGLAVNDLRGLEHRHAVKRPAQCRGGGRGLDQEVFPGGGLEFRDDESTQDVSADTEAHFALIEKRQRLTIPREQIAGFEPTETSQPVSPADPQGTGGIKGKRPSKKDKLRAAAAAQAAQAPAGHKKGP